MGTHIFGIRHHGPGSARMLARALEELQPDCILIEGPPEGDKLIHHITHPDMVPPVALLLYHPKAIDRAVYYPFAEFSPEWQAIRHGLRHQVHTQFMDLSPGYYWPKDNEPAGEIPLAPPKQDLLGRIAEVAGYPKGESWWEETVERRYDQADHFEALNELIGTVRAQLEETHPTDLHTLRREAMMRKHIRAAMKKFDRIAVVCGAFHGPALATLPAAKADNALLKGMKKAKYVATWIPWTYERLSYFSGYGAGVTSPALYELLFEHDREGLVQTWMTRVARLFRSEDMDGSPAHVIEAVRLAEALALLRGHTVPGLDELFEAVQTVFCFGDDAPLELVQQQLIIGDNMGTVPDDAPTLPLQAHIRALQKRLRLAVSNSASTVELDLRKPFHLEKSHFLHRLQLLGIKWANPAESRASLGTFRETWQLKWRPEHEIQVVEAATWGNTLPQASATKVRQILKNGPTLPQLAELLEQLFRAELPDEVYRVSRALSEEVALDADVRHLMGTLPALVRMMRYGDVRKTQSEQVEEVLKAILPRICIGLPNACRNLDEDHQTELFEQFIALNQAMQIALGLPAFSAFQPNWKGLLLQLGNMELSAPKLSGLANRLAFEQELQPLGETATAMQRALSIGTEPAIAAAWVSGFLHGSALLLIHNPTLWDLLDEWIGELPDARFEECLPLLRRTFSQFAPGERRQMGGLARMGTSEAKPNGHQPTESLDPDRLKILAPMLDLLLSPISQEGEEA
ncbi:DUF5682 family protein [Pontibacter sp. G13]|uniref:DUF5682 family protein n=1 Tax=Pontibacter sp. G13 TaxID=3074898 RepID=UPI00288B3DF8|nr:DUF5682 family protein [Pontibacter sp. G13]WNJ19720.1 DUF5682 family protein [Pontibacter sp. G13]